MGQGKALLAPLKDPVVPLFIVYRTVLGPEIKLPGGSRGLFVLSVHRQPAVASSHDPASAFVGVVGSGEIKALRKDSVQTYCVLKDLNTFQALLPGTGSLEH